MVTHTSDPKSKQDKVKVTNFIIFSKVQLLKFCKKLHTWHTFWSCLIRCVNMKYIQPELQVLQSGHRMRDGRTEGVKPIYPQQLCCAGDIMINDGWVRKLFLKIWTYLTAWIHNSKFPEVKFYKTDIKCRNTLGCLDQYTCRGLRLKQLDPWINLGM